MLARSCIAAVQAIVRHRRLVLRISAAAIAVVLAAAGIVLFVPPARDRFFDTDLWPMPLPSDVTPGQIDDLVRLGRPGDVVVESNLHYWQWVALSKVMTGSSWVHTSLLDERRHLLTVDTSVVDVPATIFLKWHSTRLALVRPPYRSRRAVMLAIGWARSKLNTPYDPTFSNPAGSCTGLVAVAVEHAGLVVHPTVTNGHRYYAAASFLAMPGARLIWTSDAR